MADTCDLFLALTVDTITSYFVVKSITDCSVVAREEKNVCACPLCVRVHTHTLRVMSC